MKDRSRFTWALLFLLVGCAGTMRDCSSCNAESFGSAWLIVQYNYDSKPMNCWHYDDVAITTEGSNGIFWKDPKSGNLIHVSGIALNRVQISGDNWENASEHLGIKLTACHNGRYDETAEHPE